MQPFQLGKPAYLLFALLVPGCSSRFHDRSAADAGFMRDASARDGVSRPSDASVPNDAAGERDAWVQDVGCPGSRPAVGTSCTQQALRCRYADLSVLTVCSGGLWGYAAATDGTACPAAAPGAGTPCPEKQTCSYELPNNDCSRTQRTDAECAAGTWLIWYPASCELSEPLACNPSGDWNLIFHFEQEDAGTGCERPVGAKDLQVRRTPDGALQFLGVRGSVDPEGCELQIHWTDYWAAGGENGSHSYAVSLHIQGGSATGQLEHRSQGFCPATHHGTVTASRPYI